MTLQFTFCWWCAKQKHYDLIRIKKVFLMKRMFWKNFDCWAFHCCQTVEHTFRRRRRRTKFQGGKTLNRNLNCIRLVPHFFSINFAYKIFNSIYKARHSSKKMSAFFGVDKTKMDLSKVYRPTWMMKINFCSKGYNYGLDYNKQPKLSRTYN